MALETLQRLFLTELRELFYAEHQLVRALPKLANAATDADLKKAIRLHLKETENHADRLEEVFQLIDQKPRAEVAEGVIGLIEEGSAILKKGGERSVLDVGIIVAAQKLEHYEIASYGSARSLADLLGQDDVSNLLQETLDEEASANQTLTDLARKVVNPRALTETQLAGTG